MFAVIETGGKQYQVEPGQSISVDRLPTEVGGEVTLDRVLMIGDEGNVTVGKPFVDGARVIAKVSAQGRQRKLIVFKYVPKEDIRTKRGHRQYFTRLTIDRIEI
jgi:large subunit ribosomal protein L21